MEMHDGVTVGATDSLSGRLKTKPFSVYATLSLWHDDTTEPSDMGSEYTPPLHWSETIPPHGEYTHTVHLPTVKETRDGAPGETRARRGSSGLLTFELNPFIINALIVSDVTLNGWYDDAPEPSDGALEYSPLLLWSKTLTSKGECKGITGHPTVCFEYWKPRAGQGILKEVRHCTFTHRSPQHTSGQQNPISDGEEPTVNNRKVGKIVERSPPRYMWVKSKFPDGKFLRRKLRWPVVRE
ncbi:hypothetical protein BT69DRAFT_1297591 [Atractiella rhizophila]|nr:hypothetical protein BT69DRAFT_1297591 [Atractiella rhizophila]